MSRFRIEVYDVEDKRWSTCFFIRGGWIMWCDYSTEKLAREALSHMECTQEIRRIREMDEPEPM